MLNDFVLIMILCMQRAFSIQDYQILETPKLNTEGMRRASF